MVAIPPSLHESSRHRLHVIGLPIDALNQNEATARIMDWARRRESRVVCICNAHSAVSALHDPLFRQAVEQADMATADGAPVAWMLRRLGARAQRRVSGPDLMEACLAQAAAEGQSIFLYGSSEATLRRLQVRLLERWPTLMIAGAISPPFRALTTAEQDAFIRQINASGAGTVWVSLGCPKQELWMARQHPRVQGVMLGVGAAFDFHAGSVERAPLWMREHGLEWLHRLSSEPGRLWRRYLVTNTLFVLAAARQLLTLRR